MAVTGPIVDAARDELPETWKALSNEERGYGDSFLSRRLAAVQRRYLGAVVTNESQELLDPLVIEYLGKRLALSVIGAGIDFWSKQLITVGAQGSRESKTYKDRAADLKTVRQLLVADVADLWLEVQPLIPNRTIRQPSVPAVTKDTTAYVGDPDLMEPPFDYTQTPSWMAGS